MVLKYTKVNDKWIKKNMKNKKVIILPIIKQIKIQLER